MGTLRDCIRKSGKLIKPADAEALHEAALQYVNDGHPADRAERAAVQSFIDETNGHLDSIYQQAGVPRTQPVPIGDRSGRPQGAAEEAIVAKMRKDAGLGENNRSVAPATPASLPPINTVVRKVHTDEEINAEAKRIIAEYLKKPQQSNEIPQPSTGESIRGQPLQAEGSSTVQQDAGATAGPDVARPNPTAQPSQSDAKAGSGNGPGNIPPPETKGQPLGDQPNPTSIKNATVDAELEAAGFPARAPGVGLTEKAAMADASAKLAGDAFAGQKLMAELDTENPRPVEGAENALLLHEWNRLRLGRDTLEKQLLAAKASGDVASEAMLKGRVEQARAEFQRAANVLKRVGTKSSDSLRLRQLMMNADYSLAAHEQRMAAANPDVPLTPLEEEQTRQRAARVEKSDKALNDHLDKQKDAETAHYFKAMVEEMRKGSTAAKKAGRSFLDVLADEAAKASDRIVARNSASAVNPSEGRGSNRVLGLDAIRDYATVGAHIIAQGAKTLADFTGKMVDRFGEAIRQHAKDLFDRSNQYLDARKAVHDKVAPERNVLAEAKANAEAGNPVNRSQVYELAREKVNAGITGMEPVMKAVHADLEPLHPGLTERQVRDAFSDYGKVKFPSREADLSKLREYRRLAQLQSAIEDAQKKESPKKTGTQRDKPTQDIREKMKELTKAMRDNGIETQSPEQQLASTNQARETALRNQIEDLTKELQTGEKPVSGKPVADSAEVTRLKATRDGLRERLNEIDAAKNGAADELARIKREAEVINKRIAEQEARLKTGVKKEATITANRPDVPALEVLRQRSRELAKQITEKERDVAKQSPEHLAEQLKRQMDALDKTIAEREAKVKAGDTSTAPTNANRPARPEIEVRKQKLAELNQQLADLRKGPEKTDAELEAARLANWKKAIARRTQDINDRLVSGNYAKAIRKPLGLDQEAIKLKAENETARNAMDDAERKREEAAAPKWKKAGDFLVGFRRFGLISGIKTLGKIGVAGQARIGITAADTIMGNLLGRLPGLRDIASRAPREGNLTGKSFENMAKGYVEGWTDTINQAARVLRTGKTEAEIAAGQRSYDTSFLNYLMNTHALLKLPAFSQEYHISLRERTAYELGRGTDMTNPINQIRVNNEAVADGLRAKFGQDNLVSKRLSMVLNSLRNAKEHPTSAKAIELVIRFLLPVTHIPMNFFTESATYNNLGLGLPRAAVKTFQAIRDGVSKLTPEQSDSIMRHWKKGSLGAGLMLMGYYLRNSIGGYYQPGKQDKSLPQFGGIRIAGHDIPRWLIHLPIFEPLHFGATMGHVMDKISKKTGESGTLGDGVIAGTAGLLDEIPYVSNARNLTEMLSQDGRGKYARGELVKSAVVPKLISDIAEYADKDKPLGPMGTPGAGQPVKRKPETFLEHIESGIPGLRQGVPSAPQESASHQILQSHADQLGIVTTAPGTYDKLRDSLVKGDDAATIKQINQYFDQRPSMDSGEVANKLIHGYTSNAKRVVGGSHAISNRLSQIITPEETKTIDQEHQAKLSTISHFADLVDKVERERAARKPILNGKN